MKFFKYASNASLLNRLRGVPRRNLNNIAYSSKKYTDSIRVMDSPEVRKWMAVAEPERRVQRMTRMDQTRKVNHDQLIDDLDMAGIKLNKSDRANRRQAESLAWAVRDHLKGRSPSRRRIAKDLRGGTKTTTNDILAKAKAMQERGDVKMWVGKG